MRALADTHRTGDEAKCSSPSPAHGKRRLESFLRATRRSSLRLLTGFTNLFQAQPAAAAKPETVPVGTAPESKDAWAGMPSTAALQRRASVDLSGYLSGATVCRAARSVAPQAAASQRVVCDAGGD
jgi:hypothetical protein